MNTEIRRLKAKLDRARKDHNVELELSTLQYLGGEYTKLKQYKVAVNYHQKCRKLASLNGDKIAEYGALKNIGFVYEKWGDYEKVLEFYKKSMKISRTFDKKILFLYLRDLIKVANLHKDQQQYQQALEFYQQALIIAQKKPATIPTKILQRSSNYDPKTQRLEGQILCNIGTMFHFLGKLQEALECYQQTVVIARKEGDGESVRKALSNTGHIYSSWGLVQEALEYYKQSLAIALKDGDDDSKRTVRGSIGSIGNLYYSHKQEQEALKYFKRSLAMAQRAHDRMGESIALNSIGLVYKSGGGDREALEHFRKSLAIAQKDGHRRSESKVLINIGMIYKSWGWYGEALEYGQQSLAIAKDLIDPVGESDALFHIGLIYKDQGNIVDAIPYFQKAIKIQDLIAVSVTSSEIRRGARIPLLNSLANLILCLIDTNQQILALAYIEYSKGREMILEGLKKNKELKPELTKLTDQRIIAHEKLQETTEKHTYYKDLAENIRGTSIESNTFFDILQKHFGDTPVKKLLKQKKLLIKRPKELNNIPTLPKTLDTLRKEGEQLRVERKDLQQEIHQKFPTEGTALPDREQLSQLIIDFQIKMPLNWIILDYFYDRIGHEYIIFVIQKKEIRLFRKKVDQEEQQLLDQTLLKIQNNAGSIDRDEAEEELNRVAKKLYSILVPEKLAKYLQQSTFQYMTIIPMGKMHSYPLELLHDGDNYWGLKFPMTRAFNLQILLAALEPKKKKKEGFALLVGNPNENMMIPKSKILGKGRKGMINASLKLISEELVELDGLLLREGYKTHTLPEENANKSAFLEALNKNPYTLIHFAGHAVFNSKNPNYSYLLLREGNEPSELYAYELPIKAVLTGNPLVNLMACETGGVVTELGDEVFGLVRGFIEAGALGITISGWIVYEFYACLFFKSFYAHYITMKLPIAESLRLARRHIQHLIHTRDEGHIHPGDDLELLHWGAYRYYGLPF